MMHEDDDFEEEEEQPLKRKPRASSAGGIKINEGGDGTPSARRGGGGVAGGHADFVDDERDVPRREIGGRVKEGVASHESTQRAQMPSKRLNTPPVDVAGSSQSTVQGGALQSPSVVSHNGAVTAAGEAREIPKAGDGGVVAEDDEALVHRLHGARAASHAMDAATKLWEDDTRFWNETQGSAILKIIQEACAYLVALARGVQPPAIRRSISLPHNTIPQHKIEYESKFNAAKERALKVQTISLRAIHGWVFKSESGRRGYHLAYQYALNHSTTDIARVMWSAEDWRTLVSPMLYEVAFVVRRCEHSGQVRGRRVCGLPRGLCSASGAGFYERSGHGRSDRRRSCIVRAS
ncbi:hypothetical protein CBR_g50198 [Chara braunii]|uniref:Uncharacterized protein n=1 Tax=Chara braunii TaxID=69332 RepID=A0A388M6E9_CHABU|nr:hypothetical protein CBR_g50198 [Chara braunii]|eukprot:GBG90106.1 hypothetical protein CBR_g50198 [Chara braunii]